MSVPDDGCQRSLSDLLMTEILGGLDIKVRTLSGRKYLAVWFKMRGAAYSILALTLAALTMRPAARGRLEFSLWVSAAVAVVTAAAIWYRWHRLKTDNPGALFWLHVSRSSVHHHDRSNCTFVRLLRGAGFVPVRLNESGRVVVQFGERQLPLDDHSLSAVAEASPSGLVIRVNLICCGRPVVAEARGRLRRAG